jgi:hypothetical protein
LASRSSQRREAAPVAPCGSSATAQRELPEVERLGLRAEVELGVAVADRRDDARQFEHDLARFQPVDALDERVEPRVELLFQQRVEQLAVHRGCLRAQRLDVVDPLFRAERAVREELLGARPGGAEGRRLTRNARGPRSRNIGASYQGLDGLADVPAAWCGLVRAAAPRRSARSEC